MKIQNDENLLARISGVLSSILSSKSPSGGSGATEQSAGAASFGALLSGMTGQQRVSFGDWIREDGTWYRSVTPPHQTRGVSYYADAEGNLYAKSVVPGAEMRSVETPDWFSGMRPGNPPVSVLGVSSQGQSSYSYGGTVTIDGKEYTTVAVNAAPGQAGGGSGFLIDNDGKWYRLSASQGNKPVSIDTPSWWDGVLPNGETNTQLSSFSASSASSLGFLRLGPWENINGTMYRTIWQPGVANRGGEYLIDTSFSWYYRTDAQESNPIRIDTPEWFL